MGKGEGAVGGDVVGVEVCYCGTMLVGVCACEGCKDRMIDRIVCGGGLRGVVCSCQ